MSNLIECSVAMLLLHGIDKIGENFLFIHWDLFEMFTDNIGKLSLVETWTCTDFMEFFVSS